MPAITGSTLVPADPEAWNVMFMVGNWNVLPPGILPGTDMVITPEAWVIVLVPVPRFDPPLSVADTKCGAPPARGA